MNELVVTIIVCLLLINCVCTVILFYCFGVEQVCQKKKLNLCDWNSIFIFHDHTHTHTHTHTNTHTLTTHSPILCSTTSDEEHTCNILHTPSSTYERIKLRSSEREGEREIGR